MSENESLAAGGDPNRLLDELSGLLHKARALSHGAPVELFHRFAFRRRVFPESAGSGLGSMTGFEDGLAVRLKPAGARGAAFAATSGRSEEAMTWAVCRARVLGRWCGGEEPWAVGRGDPILDGEAGGYPAVPGVESLRRWLRKACGPGEDAGRAGSFVEAAVTTETLVSDEGVRASRTRLRVWALIRTYSNNFEHSTMLAARDLESLPLPDRGPRQARFPIEAGLGSLPDLPIVLEPEPAASLCRALVWAFHVLGNPGAPVGPGWRVTDDPNDPSGISGGRVDDAGFVTRRTELADGEKIIGVLDGPGHLWRPSYRDPPEPLPTTVLVEPPTIELPPEAWIVSGLRVHAVEGSWVLELEGAGLLDGRIAGPLRRVHAALRPADVLARVEGGVGEPVRSGLGVVTPALVLGTFS